MLKAGDRVDGKYRLTRQIGAGAMGVVWAALNELTAREIAIKLVVRPTEELRRRLLKEARICGSLSHRNIIEVLDVGQTEAGDPYLVMPLLYGETLAERLDRQRRLDPKAAAQVTRDIARALAAAHAAGVIHRDLKPANIFLQKEVEGEAPTVKVLDFGVSKLAAAHDTRFTSAVLSGGGVGSPAYMSPEQMRMDPSLDPRSDLWSLGVILFESLTGVRPFQGESQEIMRKVLSGDIPSVSSLVRFVEPGLADLVSRCLTRDRERRIGSAAELAAALQPFTGEPRRDSGEPPLRVSSSSPGGPALALAPSPAHAQPEESDATEEATLQYRPGEAVNGAAHRWATTLPITPSSPPSAPEALPVSDAVRASLEAKGAFGTFIMNPDGSKSTAPPGSSLPSSSPAPASPRAPRRAGLSLRAAVGLVIGGSALLTALVVFFLLSRGSSSAEPLVAPSATPASSSLSAQSSLPSSLAPPQSSALSSSSAAAAPPPSSAPETSAAPAPSQAAPPVAPATSTASAATSLPPPAASTSPKPTVAAPSPSPKSTYPATSPAKPKPNAPKAPSDVIFRGPIFQ